MTTSVRRLLLAAVLAGVGLSTATTAAFSAFPDRPIRWILSHPPGGSADVIARLMQPKLEKQFGQPVIIENRAGTPSMNGWPDTPDTGANALSGS